MTNSTRSDVSSPDVRSLVLEREVRASRDAIWKALSTADGLRKWFPIDAKVVEGEGGSIWLSWGPGCEGEAPIHAWDPGHRLGWTEAGGEGIEITVDLYIDEADDTDALRVRLVQSGFGPGEEWDDYFDALKDGWSYFLFHLAHTVERHAGTPRDPVWARVPTERSTSDVWSRLTGGDVIADVETGTVTLGGTTYDMAVEYARENHCLVVRIPDLNEATLFVEFEGGGDRWTCGLYLSTFGLGEDRVSALRTDLEEWSTALLGSV